MSYNPQTPIKTTKHKTLLILIGCVLNTKAPITYNMDVTHIRVNFTLPPEMLDKLKRISKKEQRTLSNMLSILIEKYKED